MDHGTGSMVDVVLEAEDGAPPAGSGHAPGPPTAGDADVPPADAATGREPGRRRGRRWALVAAALAAVVLIADGVESRRLAERAATFASMPGTVPSLDEPLVQLWEVPPAAAASRAGDILLLRVQADGGQTRAVDVATGRQRWSVPRSGDDGLDRCVGDASATTAVLVVCWRGPGPAGVAPQPVRVAGTLVVLDARDGSVVAEHPAMLPTAGFGVVGGDVVVGHEESGELTVERMSAATGQGVWSTSVDLRGRRLGGSAVTGLRLENGFVVVRGPTTAVLDAQDGRTLGHWHGDPVTGGTIQYARDGGDVRTAARGFAVSRRVGQDGSRTATWYDRDGVARAEIDGSVVEPVADDGSSPEVLLTSPFGDSDLVAVDVAADEVLWRTPAPVGHVLVRREGAVVLADSGQVRSIDLRSGVDRWATPVAGLRAGAGMLTDGSTVVVPTLRKGHWALVALGLDDGQVRWEAPVPAGPPANRMPQGALMLWVGEVGGAAVVADGSRIAGIGPAPR